jgi:tRNA A37 methylthiotransferase MiaB
MYSERSGTAAAKAFKDDVTRKIKKQRWQILQDLMEEITFRKNQKYAGKSVKVLVDKYDGGVCFGNSGEMKLAQFLGRPEMVGRVVEVQISLAQTWILKGGAK